MGLNNGRLGVRAITLLITCCIGLSALVGCDMPGSSPSAPAAPGTSTQAASTTPPGPTATSVPPSEAPLPPTETQLPPTSTPLPRALAGQVLDAYTGKPIGGTRVSAGASAVTTQADGKFDLGLVAPAALLHVEAPGYASASVDSGSGSSLNISLRPTTLHGRVIDAATGKPIYSALVRVDLVAATPFTRTGDLPGVTVASPMLHTALVLSNTAVPATAAPPTPTATPPPVMPTPYADDKVILAVTDRDGNYTLDNVPANPMLTFKMPGYKLTKVQPGKSASLDVALQPFVAKALYLTAAAATYDPKYKPILDLADKTEINAIVLNIQDDSAHVVYNTKVQMAIDSGAVNPTLSNIKDVIAELHKHNLYVIGRVLTFMQPAVAEANPSLAVRSAVTGKPWRGGSCAQQRWLDPTNPAARRYPLALAREAVSLGFDEIQFDYIRFPSDPYTFDPKWTPKNCPPGLGPDESFSSMVFGKPADDTTKPEYIQQFATEAHNMLNLTDAFMSVDIFGYTVWPDANGQPLNASIGQVFERMIGETDYVAPMIYPSHFSAGEVGLQDPNAHPYEIVKQSGIYTAGRIADQRAKYRPWLQGFDWTSWWTQVHVVYDGHLYRLQIQAANETGAAGWMFWDPSNIYSGDGFNPK